MSWGANSKLVNLNPVLKRSISRLLSTANEASAVKNVSIIGCGLMGSGIAQVAAQSGYNVTVVDQTDALLEKASGSIDKSLTRVAKKRFPDDQKAQNAFVSDTKQRLKTTTNIQEAASSADLIIEAVIENLKIKQNLFAQLEDAAAPTAILATNTSGLCLKDISKTMKRQENFGGLHFFNPVPVMKLLEVVAGPRTSNATFNSLIAFGKKVGKTTVACKDTPGFIVNRLLVPYMIEATRMVERGDASIEDVDTAMKLGAGYPMGPFELSDYVGLDTIKFIMDGWMARFPNDPFFQPCKLLDKLVAEGKLGRKSGEGFYKHN